jgi:hypothetical protein
MFLPPEYHWLEPVVIASIVVFFIDWIGNTITFSNRVINAFMTALVFGLVFAALVYTGVGRIEISFNPPSSQVSPTTPPGQG